MRRGMPGRRVDAGERRGLSRSMMGGSLLGPDSGLQLFDGGRLSSEEALL